VRKRLLSLLVLACAGTALAVPFSATPSSTVAPTIDTRLTEALAAAAPGEHLRVVATFDAPLDAVAWASVDRLVTAGRPLKHLPMALLVVTPEQLAAVQALPGLRSLYLDRKLEYYLDASVPFIGAPRVWSELGFDGTGVTVAVIDTGINAGHEAVPFESKVVENVKIIGDDDTSRDVHVVLEHQQNTDLTSGHGTHVSSTVAGADPEGVYRGVAPGADLVGVGTGDVLFIFTALEGFDWVMEHQDDFGIRVINNSWGTDGPFDPNDPVNVASKAAVDAGMIVVFAAGNSGPRSDSLNPYSVAPWVIGVAAGNRTERTLADFSSRGVHGDSLYQPTITAPGVDIVAADFLASDGYVSSSGTSMASPHVAGVAALMLQANPALSPAAVKQILKDTATPMPEYSVYTAGAGYVDAYAATQRAAAVKRIKKHRDKNGNEIDVYVTTQTFEGIVAPAAGAYNGVATANQPFDVAAGAVWLDVRLTWQVLANDIDLFMLNPSGETVVASQDIQALTLAALEGAAIDYPVAGQWTARVRGWLNGPELYRVTVETYYPIAAP
jgi:serine protease AprX